MRKIGMITIVFALIISIVGIQSVCFAQNMVRKLGRGVANIGTSIFEMPKSIQEKLYDHGPAAAATYGVFDGVYKFVLRTLVGIYEVVTFPIPFPADYAPMIEPEFLFSPDEPYSFHD